MHYSDKKVAILGFGVEGQDAARYFLGQKSVVTVFDQKEKSQIVTDEWKAKPIKWVCGSGYLDGGLGGFDVIVRSPGAYRYKPEIVEAEKQGSKITSNTILFFEESEANIIGITGTKGKGTTAQMLKLALEAGGKKVLLLGNIGTPMLDRIDDADTFDWVILELSSFQLIDLPCSPPIAVVTNIATDHLNWHKNREEYINAKKNLWIHQKPTDTVIFNYDDETSREFAKTAPGKVVWFSKKPVDYGTYLSDGSVVVAPNDETAGDIYELQVPGIHNVENALAALTAACVAGVRPLTAWWGDPHKSGEEFEYDGICGYKGSEHRLEVVAEIDGVVYINDSAATTPEAAIVALQSFEQPKILVAGGSLKGVGFSEFARAVVKENVKAVFLIGEAAEKIEIELEKGCYRGEVVTGLEDMKEIVGKAKIIAETGDVVLLSPACASFGLFQDYKDRGGAFKRAVRRLQVC